MAWFFGDGFELYAAPADAYVSGTYWDSSNGAFTLVAGRFSGSRGIQITNFSATVNTLLKNSGSNDTTHHLNIAIQQTTALTGTGIGTWFTFFDGATAQCSIVFRQDGAILLTAGVANGTTLATYLTGITASNTWYGFEIEVIVSNTAGSMTIRKSGNPSNDFASATNLDTSQTANNYANRLVVGNGISAQPHQIDDLLWRSDSTVPWAGELRCYTRMPVSDSSVQWTPSGAVVPMPSFPVGTTTTTGLFTASNAFFMPFVPVADGTVGTLTLSCATAVTGNIKCSIYASAAGAPTTVLGSANLVTNPGVGTTTFTFAAPVAVTRGVTYYAAFRQDVSSGTFTSASPAPATYGGLLGAATYAAFPTANPVMSGTATAFAMSVNITPTAAANAPFVADTQQDAAASYVSSSTPGQTDLYGIAPISGTPTGIIGVTTRALAQKSDAGTRNVALRLKSGAADVTGTSTALGTSFAWIYRNDLVDPATGAAWSAVAVANLKIGLTVSA